MTGPVFDEHAFQRLAEFSSDALVVHSQGRVLWANPAAARLLGVATAGELVGRVVLDFVAAESVDRARERIAVILETGQPQPAFPEVFLRNDGSRVEVEVAASSLGNGSVLVSARDVSARLTAERATRRAEARARAFFDATTAPAGVSRNGVHVEVNAAYARLFGYDTPTELVGVPIFQLIASTDHARITEYVRARARGAQVPHSYSVKGVRRDGTALELEVHAANYAEGDGVTTVVVMRDVTAQLAFQTRLTQSEERHRALVSDLPVGVWEEDLSGPKAIIEGLRRSGVGELSAHFAAHPEDLVRCAQATKLLSANPAVCAMVEARDEAQLRAQLERVFIAEAMEALALLLVQFDRGQELATAEGWNGTLSGGRRWVSVRATIIEGHRHDWSRVLVTTVDMTDRFRAAQEKAALEEQLRHGEKLEAIGRLAGGVAHDFNNLLAVIMSSTEVARVDTPESAPTRESLDLIHEASLRARDLVKQILTFGRKDRPKAELLDLSATIDDALVLARAAVPSTVTMKVSIARAVGLVRADRTQLHQVLMNLCANARDAVSAQGTIEVSLSREAAPDGSWRARLRVKDDGVGMDEATRARLFEPYHTTKTLGHGLGLAVVHGIVTSAGGSIEVESTAGHGARFDVFFPLHDGAVENSERAAQDVGGHERVLLVEDQPMVRSAMRRLLTSLGYVVTEASDGQDALEQFLAAPSHFDLVLSDQTMPRLSGLELARRLLKEHPTVRLLLCTGYSEQLDEAAALALGVRGVLAKPVDRASMAAAVRAALS